MSHIEAPPVIAEGCQESAEVKPAPPVTDDLELPVAYEEVTLTDEAAAILEEERKAAAKRVPRKLRRVPLER